MKLSEMFSHWDQIRDDLLATIDTLRAARTS